MSKWRPIETMPVDGTWVLLHWSSQAIRSDPSWYWNEYDGPQTDIGRTVRHPEKRYSIVDTEGLDVIDPTHWMPLPEPPE